MKLWLVERHGVYQQGTVGIFTRADLAKTAKEEAEEEECDDYHQIIVTEMDADKRESLFQCY